MDTSNKSHGTNIARARAGLRVIRGDKSAALESKIPTTSASGEDDTNKTSLAQNQTRLSVVTPTNSTRRNPLLTQLSALADAIDNDVKQILKL